MADREKVIKGLCCLSDAYDTEKNCDNCEYDFASCVLDVSNDALELLKEREAIRENLVESIFMDWYKCPECKETVYYGQNYCADCGTRFKWTDE